MQFSSISAAFCSDQQSRGRALALVVSMHSVRKEAAFAKEHGLFKAASAWNVTSNLLQPSNVREQPQQPDRLYDSLPSVSRVDFFISHSWSCPSWMKTLAFCHFLNLDLAIGSSCFAGLLAALLLILKTGSFTGVAQLPQDVLYASLLCWPMAAFLMAYLLGHCCCGWHISFWFDRICVDQVNDSVKAQTLQAIPAFVAQSSQMLVLWDDTYFERLWCNYELSVHAKTAVSPLAMQLVPMWISLWTLAWIGLYTIQNFLLVGEKSPQLDLDSRSALFSSMVDASFVPAVYLLSAFPFSWGIR